MMTSRPSPAEVIAEMRCAKVIVRFGIGVDNVDLKAARNKGIPVCNVPDYCIDEVADHTLAFILATTRQVVPNCLHVREGGQAQWIEALGLLSNHCWPDDSIPDLLLCVLMVGDSSVQE